MLAYNQFSGSSTLSNAPASAAWAGSAPSGS